MRTQQIPKPPEIGATLHFTSRYDLKRGGYRWIQYNGYRLLVRIIKKYGYDTWRSNNGLGERKYRYHFKGRIVDPKIINPILDCSKLIQYGDNNTTYITKLYHYGTPR